MQDTQEFAFDIGHAVEGVGEQAARAGIERQRHGVHGEVAAAHVVINGARRDLHRLARLLVALGARAGDFRAHVAGQQQHDRTRGFVHSFGHGAGLLEVLLQLEGVALHGKVQIANDEPADDVADRAAREKDVHLVGPRYVGHQRQSALLVRREPRFHEIDKIGHRFSNTPRPVRHRPDWSTAFLDYP